MGYTPYQYLPLFAKLAVDRLDQDHSLRDTCNLDFLVVAYAKTYGQVAEDQVRDSVLHICQRRFGETFDTL